MKKITHIYSNPKQTVLPILIQDYLDISDPVLTFNRFMGEIDLEKYLKEIPKHEVGFPMFKKETTDRNYHEDPFRAVNFKIDGDGKMRCPNGKGFHLQYRKEIKGNAYGREEEIYQCEDCSGCPYAEKCKKEKETVPCVSIRN